MIDTAKIAGPSPVTDTLTAAPKPQPEKAPEAKGPAVARDSLTINKPSTGIPSVNLVSGTTPDEEPNRKAGVTFKNMLKAAQSADKDGFTNEAIPLFSRAVALADDPGDICKVIHTAKDQAYSPVVKQALAKGLTIANKSDQLQDLAKLADARGMRTEAEALVSKAVTVTNDAKHLRKLAEFADRLHMQTHAQAAYGKIADLPAKTKH